LDVCVPAHLLASDPQDQFSDWRAQVVFRYHAQQGRCFARRVFVVQLLPFLVLIVAGV
jgi:hypothetical protein